MIGLGRTDEFDAAVGQLDLNTNSDFTYAADLCFCSTSVESLALEQAEHDFNLVQPTRRSRREVKLDSALKL